MDDTVQNYHLKLHIVDCNILEDLRWMTEKFLGTENKLYEFSNWKNEFSNLHWSTVNTGRYQ